MGMTVSSYGASGYNSPQQGYGGFQPYWSADGIGSYFHYSRPGGAAPDYQTNQMPNLTDWGAGDMGGGGTGTGTSADAAYNAANAANTQRYNDILQGYGDSRRNIMGRLEGYGQSLYNDVNRRYDRLNSATQQDMTNRGLSNSTLPAAARMGLERQKSEDLTKAGDSIAEMLSKWDYQTAKDPLVTMENKTDLFPDYSLMAQLAQQMGYGPQQFGYNNYVGG